METAKIFSLMASLLVCGTFVLYVRLIARSAIKPNPSTWLIVTTVMSVNAGTFIELVQRNIWSGLMAIIIPVLAMFMVFYCWIRGRFAPVSWAESLIAIASIGLLVVWKITGSAELTNLLTQGLLLISFAPSIIGVIRRTTEENPWPWTLGIASYVMQIISLLLTPKTALAAFAWPIIDGIFGNGILAATIWIVNCNTRKKAEEGENPGT